MTLELGGLYHPPYTADLEPSDFRLVGYLKMYLTGKKFETDADVKQAVISWLQTLETDFFCGAIQALVPQWYIF
jgi:histone-lysine N-methyltransferase SETMAR